MYQTQQTEALCLSVYLYGAILFSRGIRGSVWQTESNEGKETCSKGVMDEL